MSKKTFAPIEEGTTGVYTATLKDEHGTTLSGIPFTGARLTLHSYPSGAVINAREGQDVLNNGSVPEFTISAAGVVTWKLVEADTLIVEDPKPQTVKHRAELVLEWEDAASIPRQLTHALEFPITALRNAPFDA